MCYFCYFETLFISPFKNRVSRRRGGLAVCIWPGARQAASLTRSATGDTARAVQLTKAWCSSLDIWRISANDLLPLNLPPPNSLHYTLSQSGRPSHLQHIWPRIASGLLDLFENVRHLYNRGLPLLIRLRFVTHRSYQQVLFTLLSCLTWHRI